MAPHSSDLSMKSGGYYSQHTANLAIVVDQLGDELEPALRRYVDSIATSKRPLQLLDLGSSDGGNSRPLIRRVLNCVADTSLQVLVTYNDLPSNDFGTVFRHHAGAYGDDERVFASASGTSFFEQTLPDASVDIAFSCNAVHLLSTLPSPRADFFLHFPTTPAATVAAYREQARLDWHHFLLSRAKELRRGALLAVAVSCLDARGHYRNESSGGEDLWYELRATWRALLAQGRISEEEFERFTYPAYYRSESECAEPFQQGSEVFQAGLRLESIAVRAIPCPFAAARKDGVPHDVFVDAFVPSIRAWSECFVAGALERSRADRRAVVDRFYEVYEGRVRESPERHAADMVKCFVIARKV